MLALVQEERGEASGGVDGVVVRKLGSDKVLIPVVVVGADVGTEDLDHRPIGSLGLSVSLGVTSRGHVEVGLESALQLDPEIACELGVSV